MKGLISPQFQLSDMYFCIAAVSLLLLLPAPVKAACTAGNPNAQLVEDTPTSAFTDNADGTVTHQLTGLTWDRCAWGQAWESSTKSCINYPERLTWNSALKAAVTANESSHRGVADWRLPNLKELISIVENCGGSPAINLEVFPRPGFGGYWSSTSIIADTIVDPRYKWSVHFNNAGVITANIRFDNSNHVRLVRGGAAVEAFDAIADIQSIPAMSAWSLGLLSGLLGIAGVWIRHRARKDGQRSGV